MSEQINIRLNGEIKNFQGPITLSELLGRLSLSAEKVVVEQNLKIIPKDKLSAAASELAPFALWPAVSEKLALATMDAAGSVGRVGLPLLVKSARTLWFGRGGIL